MEYSCNHLRFIARKRILDYVFSYHDLSANLFRHYHIFFYLSIYATITFIKIALWYCCICLSVCELITKIGMMMCDPSCCFLHIDSSLHHWERQRCQFFLIIAWLVDVACFLQHAQKILSTGDVHYILLIYKVARWILIGAILFETFFLAELFLRQLPCEEWRDYARELCKKCCRMDK